MSMFDTDLKPDGGGVGRKSGRHLQLLAMA